jgi:hypothetical protein
MALTDDTVRVLQLIDHDAQFEFNQNQSGIEPVILNRIDLSAPNFVDQLSELIFSDGTGADFIARCQCGETEGNNKVGMTCPICETIVTRAILLEDDNLVCKNWIANPRSI